MAVTGPCGPAGNYHISCYKNVDLNAVKAAKQACFGSWPKPEGCTATLLPEGPDATACPTGVVYYFPTKVSRQNGLSPIQ
jgi:hypothetical protein